MTRKLYLLALLLLLITPAARSQEVSSKNSLNIGWGIAFPAQGNFENNTSFVVPSLGYERLISPKFSAGFSAGMLYTKESGVTRDRCCDGALIDGYSDRKLSLIPLQLYARYFPTGGSGASFQPFLSVAGGVQYACFQITGDQINTSRRNNWAGVFTPELGVRYAAGKRTYIDLSGYFQYGGNKWALMKTTSQQYFGVRAGIGFNIF